MREKKEERMEPHTVSRGMIKNRLSRKSETIFFPKKKENT